MEVVWTLLLTACFTDTDCRYQNVQFFDSKQECIVLKTELEVMKDGHWKTIAYQCKPLGSL